MFLTQTCLQSITSVFFFDGRSCTFFNPRLRKLFNPTLRKGFNRCMFIYIFIKIFIESCK